MEKRKFDIGIVVPLREEFRYVVEVAPQLESISHEGTYFYRLDFGTVSAVGCLVDQMGPLPALQATTRLLGFADVKLLVVLGVGGALDGDVVIGDVVVAAEINEFQANSKAESAADAYEVRYSGRHWPLEFRIREAISHFEFSSHEAFARWQAIASGDYAKLEIPGKENICSPTPSLHLGPIASGSVVAASSAFVAEVKRINRKFLAIDMEAAGVAPAAAERIHPLPCLVMRGMADHANEEKKIFDRQGKGAWRRYCVRNATSLLRNLLAWDGFLKAAGLGTFKSPAAGENLLSELVVRLQGCIGGPWIVGVAFGIYSHGPYVRDRGNVVPMDLNRLRVLDTRVADLMDAAETQKEQLIARDDIGSAVNGFVKLVGDFRHRLSSADADLLLQEFDRVITEIIHPDNEDEQVESLLLESNRLEEEVGAQAVIQLLKDIANGKPRLRERYVDALAAANEWAKIIKTIEEVDQAQLSRRELEAGVFAYAKKGLADCANKMMRLHQSKYDDNGAKLFRRQLSQQYPEIGEDLCGEKK